MRGLLYSENYRPFFSGHETFALRQMWLKKAFDAASPEMSEVGSSSQLKSSRAKSVFADPAAIQILGVGKNMVGSIRHWSIACDVLTDSDGLLSPSTFGQRVFRRNGLDPYGEHVSSLWLVHWKLAGGWRLSDGRIHRSATWYWVFNHIHEQSFTSQNLLTSLSAYADQKHASISAATLKRDIEVFLRCYIDRGEASIVDDYADSMLSDLGLIAPQSRDEYALRRGPKSTLTDGAFLYALIDFWNAYSPEQNTLSFDTIAYEIGSPGRVFKLDEDFVAAKIMGIESLTGGAYQWSDTAGLRQVVCRRRFELSSALELAYA